MLFNSILNINQPLMSQLEIVSAIQQMKNRKGKDQANKILQRVQVIQSFSWKSQRFYVINFLMQYLNSWCYPLHARAFFTRPNNISELRVAFWTIEFDLIFLTLRQPFRSIDKIRAALFSMNNCIKQPHSTVFASIITLLLSLHIFISTVDFWQRIYQFSLLKMINYIVFGVQNFLFNHALIQYMKVMSGHRLLIQLFSEIELIMKYPPCTTQVYQSYPSHRIKKARHSTSFKNTPTMKPSNTNSNQGDHSRITSTNSDHYQFHAGEDMEGYRITKQFGEGTFGRVVEGERKGRRYAIKIIRPVVKYIESAKIERDILKAINKRDQKDEEGIVRYKHSFQHAGHFCMVFQPLGSSLFQLIKKNNYRGFPIKMVQNFFRQILKSISFIHKLGYTHTDLKPQNILLENEELIKDTSKDFDYWLPKNQKVRIIDFGGATLFNEAHSSVICTRQYRPPEVILECCKWNQIADVWSIGCIIVELFTGDLLFPTHSDCEHLLMIQKNSGRFPQWMINKAASSSMRKLFRDGTICEAQAERQLQHWQNIKTMKTSQQILGEFESLKDLIQQCLQIDPNKRINCVTALRHRFFKEKFV